jgi:hyperosmotically inducible protein
MFIDLGHNGKYTRFAVGGFAPFPPPARSKAPPISERFQSAGNGNAVAITRRGGRKIAMKRLVLALFTISLIVPAAMEAKTEKPVTLPEAIRHQLAMLPRYNVFDNLTFRVDGGTVTLGGEVTQPIVKDDAANAVRHVEGVTMVVNNIEVLPLSPADDRLRMAVYRAVYSAPTLSTRYGFQASPSIHIIVKNGVVRLEGVVASQADRTIAGIRASGVFGSFKVENNLQIAS